MEQEKTLLLCVYGIVQGVGFRPFVSVTAQKFNLCGNVCNKGSYVEIYIQGVQKNLDNFVHELQEHPPVRSAILNIDIKSVKTVLFSDFQIIESSKEKGAIFVSPDIAVCETCKKELYDKKNRRYLHPFINCTACGPRLTILDAMPYDRERTSMKTFAMCRECMSEYHDSSSRRYDAQPVCCHSCGPKLYLLGRNEENEAALLYTKKIIREGGIAAIKGIGGFHLCCDATSEKAVKRLRTLKKRPYKPFAVMMKDIDTAKRECLISNEEMKIITGHQKPVLLLEKSTTGLLCDIVAPENPYIGIMLPYAPVQLLLFDNKDAYPMPDCFVMTSGNISGAPICCSDKDVKEQLLQMCDVVLSNDREIRIRADDSVMSFYNKKPYMIRRSRGYAPLPFMLSRNWKGQVAAIGGELKNTFCIGKDNLFYQSPYIGDMSDVRTIQALKDSLKRMEELLEAKPMAAACDLHPRYHTRIVAEELGLPVYYIQHHYAHIVSCMAENDCQNEVIGVSFDGTGYGTDGSIWGGEFLKASYLGFERLGSIEPFIQAGGDASAKEGWRIAVSLLYGIYKDEQIVRKLAKKFMLCDDNTMNMQFFMLQNQINCIKSTSMGRVFDGVSAILGLKHSSSFEGEASMALEYAGRKVYLEKKEHDIAVKTMHNNNISEHITNKNRNFFHINTNNLVKKIVEGKLNQLPIEVLAYQFHESLAEMITNACLFARKNTGIDTIALSGGVFQNLLLLQLCTTKLKKHKFNVLTHSMLPTNDGGIALGQATAVMARLNQ